MKHRTGKTRYPWLKYVKFFSWRINRRRTKAALCKEDYDAIPKDKPVYTEDTWNWD